MRFFRLSAFQRLFMTSQYSFEPVKKPGASFAHRLLIDLACSANFETAACACCIAALTACVVVAQSCKICPTGVSAMTDHCIMRFHHSAGLNSWDASTTLDPDVLALLGGLRRAGKEQKQNPGHPGERLAPYVTPSRPPALNRPPPVTGITPRPRDRA